MKNVTNSGLTFLEDGAQTKETDSRAATRILHVKSLRGHLYCAVETGEMSVHKTFGRVRL